MTTEAAPLQDLRERIDQQAAELARLRQEFGERRRHLRELNRQKLELQKQLERIDAQIMNVSQVAMPVPAAAAMPIRVSVPSKPVARNGMSFKSFLVSVVKEMKRPITIKELSEEVVRRKFPTNSKNITSMVETRVSELVRENMLRRSSEGLMPGKGSGAPAARAKPSQSTKTSGPAQQMTLKQMVTHILGQSPRPLVTNELAKAILKAGYKTKSKNLNNVLWVSLGSMDNVERVAEGYRLKAGAATANKK